MGQKAHVKHLIVDNDPHLSRFKIITKIFYLQSKYKAQNAIFGHFWPLISNIIFSLVLATIFLNKAGTTFLESFMYVSSGLMIWSLLADNINAGKTKISEASSSALHNGLTIIEYLLLRVLITFYPITIILPFLVTITIMFGQTSFFLLLLVPYLFMLYFVMLSLTILTSIFSTIFPKSSDLVSMFMRFLFFLTPVFWSKDTNQNSIKNSIHDLNPISYIIELFRALIGLQTISVQTVMVFISFLLILLIFALICIRLFNNVILNVS